ncbi:MAG: hypothetical protein Q9163_003190 [Psora crenata]
MAPSPAAGKAPQAPKTPTKQGKNPASSATSKLGQSQSASDSPKETAKSATNTPKQAAGGAGDKAKQASGGSDTKSPKLPPRPKAGQASQQAKGATQNSSKPPAPAQKPLQDTEKKAADTAKDTTEDTAEKADDAANEADTEETDTPGGKVSQPGNETGEEGSSAVSTAEDDTEDATGGAQEAAEGAAEGTGAPDTDEETADEATGGVGDAVKGAAGKATDGNADGVAEDAKGATGKATDAAGKAADGDADGVAEDAEGYAEDAESAAEDAVPDDAKDAVDGVKDQAEDAEDQAEGAADQLPEPDLSVLKGLQVGEGGEILDSQGNPIGQLDEGDPEDLVGKKIGDDGEILDEDGDVIGRASVLPDKAQELANNAKEGLPDIGVLEGLEVGEGGEIMGPDGTPLGKITEGNPEDLVGKTLNENGEILDEDGDVIGRAEVVPGEAADKIKEQAEGAPSGLTADLSILQGKKVNKKGNILDDEGEPIGRLTEDSDPKKCAGKVPNKDGLIIDEEGNVVGKVEVVPGEAAEEAMKALHPDLLEDAKDTAEDAAEDAQATADDVKDTAEDAKDAAEDAQPEIPGLPGMDILEGLKVNKKGEVLNEDGEPIAKLSEGELADCQGKKLNERGEVLDKDGNVIGKVELIPSAFPEVAEAAQAAELSVLDGLKVNKKGEVVNEDGDPIARLSEGELGDCIGKKINEKGEVLDAKGNVIGRVELIPQEGEAEGDNEEGEGEGEGEGEDRPDFSSVEGYKVNKSGNVVNEDGEVLARLVEGELEQCAGKKVNDKGEVLDAEGNVIGKVELGSGEDEGPELPPLSILEGCKCNKNGKIVDSNGNPKGELIEGDPKRLAKMGAECDAEGQFWDGKGHVIGRGQTLPAKDEEEEGAFAGLEGLIVVPDGFVEDENQNKVGKLVEGDPKKLVGRAVDEDGDVIDKHGNVVGHAERLPEEEEVAPPDLSILKGLTVNKQGNVIGPDGVPIARLVEGNVKELAGRKCDEQGQIWNDSGKVVGRCELIPENERESKPEGPFAGLEGCVVVKDGMVEDEDGNTVGIVVEGDPKRLVGRAVDEDGDIIDKYGNVKGHAEPYEEPEEEVADLSSLEGKVVNKTGKVVDEHGTIYGRIAEGDPTELAGKKVDGQGQIWSDNGKVIGRAELIPGGGTQKPEGPFAGFENLVVAKDGFVTDGSGQIVGKLVEGSDAQKLLGRKVDEDGDILDNSGNSIGKAERYTPEEKKREINPMAGHKVNKDGEVRDENGELLGMVTDGHLPTLIGKEVDDNGYVIDNDGNKIGECTLIQNIPQEEEEEEQGLTEEELQKQKDAELAKKMNGIVVQTIEKMQPICKDITELIEAAERKPKEELDEEELVKQVKPKIEEGNRILQECNGAIRGMDPDGTIAQNAKARSASGEATKEEHMLANSLKELTSTIVTTIENAKKKIAGMPHAKKELNALWYLLSEPLFQIIAAVGLLLSGVLGLVGKLLNGLGLGGLINGLLGGLGIEKLLGGLGLGSITKSLGLGGKKK